MTDLAKIGNDEMIDEVNLLMKGIDDYYDIDNIKSTRMIMALNREFNVDIKSLKKDIILKYINPIFIKAICNAIKYNYPQTIKKLFNIYIKNIILMMKIMKRFLRLCFYIYFLNNNIIKVTFGKEIFIKELNN